jgi:hypothetical protein
MLDRMLTAPKQELRIRQIMDKGQVLVANLAKGRIGDDSSSLLGGLLVTTIGLAAYTRADTSPDKRRDFFVYVDEVQSFATLALANMLSELRKYRVGFKQSDLRGFPNVRGKGAACGRGFAPLAEGPQRQRLRQLLHSI